jgi:branched-chain amino acid transport system permease protein
VTEVLQQLVNGLASGGVYAGLALAVSVIFQGTGLLNFAQGEMAVVAAYGAWSLAAVGWPPALAIPIVVAGSAALGAVMERVLVRPVEGASPLAMITVTAALLLGLNGVVSVIWGTDPHSLESPFGNSAVRLGSVVVTAQQIGAVAVVAVVMVVVGGFFRFTSLGLRMKAVALNPASAVLLGIRPGRMLAVGWALAGAVGAVAGVMAAPMIGLNPEMMQGPLLMAFAAAALGGFTSPFGSALGGVVLGVLTALTARYVPALGGDLALAVPFGVIFVVLLVKPSGLFGRAAVVRS